MKGYADCSTDANARKLGGDIPTELSGMNHYLTPNLQVLLRYLEFDKTKAALRSNADALSERRFLLPQISRSVRICHEVHH